MTILARVQYATTNLTLTVNIALFWDVVPSTGPDDEGSDHL
jgi:hypothetical protein